MPGLPFCTAKYSVGRDPANRLPVALVIDYGCIVQTTSGGIVAKARRAKVRPSRAIAPIAVVLALVIGGVAFANRSAGGTDNAEPGATSSVLGTASTAAPQSATPSTPSSPQPSASSARQAASALSACQLKVRQADRVLQEAKTGIGHWAEHVQAQTDANADVISVEKMDGTFKQTRLAGPADQKRYADALSDYRELKGSCQPVKGAPESDAQSLADCAQRSQAQQPVLAAAAAGMKDWRSHLAAMQRSREGHVENAEEIWLKAWRAAPPHINAYQNAAANLDAPTC